MFFELCILFFLLILFVNQIRQSPGEEGELLSTRIAQYVECIISPKPSQQSIEKTSQNVSRHRYKHNSSPFAVDGGGFARFEINHGLKELSWQESYQRNSQARRFGKRGKITLNIVDLEGNPIPNAKVHYFFNISDDTCVHATHVYTETDENGVLPIEGRSIDYVYFIVSKEGFYETKHFYSFLVRKHDCYEGGRWIPWNPTLEVVLRPIQQPVKREYRYAELVFPSRNEPYGFDCEVGDLVEPFGSGKVSDFHITFSSDATPDAMKQYRFTNEVLFTSTSSEGAFQVRPLDLFSQFPYDYEAPEEGYTSTLSFSRRLSGPAASLVHTANPLEEANYILLRLREQRDENGTLLSAQYGKIVSREFNMKYSSKKNTLHLRFFYYVNPVPNDRNLEGEDDYWELGKTRKKTFK